MTKKGHLWNRFGVGCVANHRSRGNNMVMRWFNVKNASIGKHEKPTYMRRLYLVATRDIKSHDELTYNYGNNCKYMLDI